MDVKRWYDKLNPAQQAAYQRGVQSELQSKQSHRPNVNDEDHEDYQQI